MWHVTTDNGNLVYKLEMNERLGTLEVKQGPTDHDVTWVAYHNGILLHQGPSDVQLTITYCNELAAKLT